MIARIVCTSDSISLGRNKAKPVVISAAQQNDMRVSKASRLFQSIFDKCRPDPLLLLIGRHGKRAQPQNMPFCHGRFCIDRGECDVPNYFAALCSDKGNGKPPPRT